jgi:hypothetical protein
VKDYVNGRLGVTRGKGASGTEENLGGGGDDDNDNDNATAVSSKWYLILSSRLRSITKDHFPLVAQEIANFLYVTVPDRVTHPHLAGTETVENGGSADVRSSHSDRFLDETIVSMDPHVQAGRQEWDTAREQYVQSFQRIQNQILDAYARGDDQRREKHETSTTNWDDEDEIQEETGDSSTHDAGDLSDASLMQSFYEVSPKHNPDLTSPAAPIKADRPRFYVMYEAMAVGSSTQRGGVTYPEFSYSENVFGSDDAFPVNAPTDRLVIVDNLPIDVSNDRLLDAYGRCGPIAALKIFHQRPELDPGRKRTDGKKKIRRPASSVRRQRWERPRTPLYAMILYGDPIGAERALADPLRIFGMVVDRHLVRSHRPGTMTKLFLEGVPSAHHDAGSIEYELAQVLQPDLYLCLDSSVTGGRPRGRPPRSGTSDPLNCVIQFPCFEAAYWAYWKLNLQFELLRGDDDCGLHWMETPNDAMLYWTRKLNF